MDIDLSSVDWVTIVGYIASILVGVTFMMKTMIPLRMVGIASNIVFITYGLSGQLYPVLILHCFLLPLNIYRLTQMKKLIKKVDESAKGEFDYESLIPFMTKEKFSKGDVLFEENASADKLYYIASGSIHLPEYDITVSEGQLFGEMGLFAPDAKRTSKAVIDSDAELYSLTKAKIMELYFQQPSFGFNLIQLLTSRFIEDIDRAQEAAEE